MKSILLFLLLSILLGNCNAQDFFVKLSIPDYPERELSFCSQFGDKSRIIETFRTDKNGYVSFNTTDLEIGVYRVYFDSEVYFDIIINKENISLSLLANAPLESMEVIESIENRVLYNFLKQNNAINQKLDVLEYFLAKYAKGKLYKRVTKEYQEVIKEQAYLADNVTAGEKNTFAAGMIQYYKTPIIPKEVAQNGNENMFLREKFFTYFPFDDTLLVNSSVYSSAVLNYLKLFAVSGDYGASVQGFKSASERILNYTRPREAIFSHVLKILVDGFESLQLFDIADYLLENYGSKCVDDDNLSLRYKNITELPLQSKAPVVEYIDKAGNITDSYENKNTIIVFWATWCDHCRQVIPELSEYFETNHSNSISVVLISLDTDKSTLDNFVRENSIDLPVICDYRGWEGTYVELFAIYATPFFYVVGPDGAIVSKPHDYNELLNVLKSLK